MLTKTTIIKIIGVMIVSFIISFLLVRNIFIASSPKLRQNLGPYLIQQASVPVSFLADAVSAITQSLSNMHLFTLINSTIRPASPATRFDARRERGESSNKPTSSSSPQAIVQSLQSIPFNNPAPGIYTKEDTHNSYLLIKEQEVQWQDYAADSDGKQIIIRVPKGDQMPDPNIIKKL